MLSYKDYGKLFDTPVLPVGAIIEQPNFNYDSELLQDFLLFYSSNNPLADTVTIEIKFVNSNSIETNWRNFFIIPGTNGFIESIMMGQNMGYGFKLRIINNAPVQINDFKLWLQGKAM